MQGKVDFDRVTIRSLIIALAALLSQSPHVLADTARPNVVVILTDDQGWGDLSIHGNTNLSTPRIDSLAREGALFDRFYVCPVCSPTRAEFLTGRYHPRGGVFSTSTGGERLDLDERTIAQCFKQAGYATAAYGKWHNGIQYPYHPNARGFDDYYGFCSGHWGDYFSPPLEHNGRPVNGDGFIIDDFTNHALQFIDQHREQPFFLYLPYNTPHSPMQVPDLFYDKFRHAELSLRADESANAQATAGKKAGGGKEDLNFTRAALAMCENIDWNVGRVLTKLDETKLAERTIVLYFCDNGPNGPRWNGGMKGRKGSTDEGGVRSPLLMRWPGKIKPGTVVKPIAGAIDLLPTLADLAGVPLDAQAKPLDGVSIAPVLRGETTTMPERIIFSHWAGKVSARTQRFRLDHEGKLFDMQADPGQRKAVNAQHAAVADNLTQAVAAWRSSTLAELTMDDRPYPVGYRQFPLTTLPARDGIPHGQIARSAKAPNCSYFTNWINAADTITWDIEVATAGRYEAVVYYTCRQQDLGARVELRFNESHVAATIDRANDPPARGAEHDRTDRGTESYVKDFQPFRLGELPLETGRGQLTLAALAKPGEAVIEVRAVQLKLLP